MTDASQRPAKTAAVGTKPLFNAQLVRQSYVGRYWQGRLSLTMASPARLHNAVKSLTAALDLLDAAIERRERAEAARRDLVDELAVMEEDRARLAEELDASLARAERITSAARTVGERLDRMDALCADALAVDAPANA